MNLPPAGSDEKVQSSTHADVHNRFVGEQYGSREFIMHERSHCEGSQAVAPTYTSLGGIRRNNVLSPGARNSESSAEPSPQMGLAGRQSAVPD